MTLSAICAEESEGASYGMEALALGGLTETGLLLTDADSVENGSFRRVPSNN
jgi:hypothetical protein